MRRRKTKSKMTAKKFGTTWRTFRGRKAARRKAERDAIRDGLTDK